MPFKYNPNGPVQPGLPGVLPEEAPLPSEVVLDGGVLDRRRREALGALRATLLDRPADIAPDEWRVVVATLAPPAAHLGRAPGTAAGRYSAVQAAKECFPALSPTAAVKRFREIQARPAVRAFVADMRALEMLDVFEQRGPVRERLWSMIRLADHIDPQVAVDPEMGGNHCKAAMVAVSAMKLLIDMDGLKVTPDEAGAGESDQPDDSADVGASLRAKAERVIADLRARKAETAGT